MISSQIENTNSEYNCQYFKINHEYLSTNEKPINSNTRRRICLIKKKKAQLINIVGLKEGKWDMAEHKEFLNACLLHGNNWAKVFL